MFALRSTILAAAMVISTIGAASAASYTVSTAFGPQTTDYTTGTLTLTPFNTALGTLTDVSISFNVSGSFNGTVKNNATGAQDFDVSEAIKLKITSGVAGLSGLNASLSATQSYTALASGATAAFGPYTPTASATANPGPLAIYSTGPLTFTVSTQTSTTILGGGGNIAAAIATNAGGSVVATYTYTPTPPPGVPEPASMALLGAGLVGLGMLRRKRS